MTEDAFDLGLHEGIGDLAERPEREFVEDFVIHARLAAFIRERVRVMPDGIRPLELLVHESVGRIPGGDAGAPTEGDAVELEPIVDQRALPHHDGHRGRDPELQFGRRDRLEVRGPGEEIEDLLDRHRQQGALEVAVHTAREGVRGREVVSAVLADDFAVIGHGGRERP